MQFFNGYFYPDELLVRKRKEKRELKYIGCFVGGAVLLYVFLQQLLSLTVYIDEIYYAYGTSAAFRGAFSIILSIIGLFIPFLIAGRFIKKKTGREFMCFGKPVSYSLMFSAVFSGFFICLIGNYATDVFVTFAESVGIELSSPDFEIPEDTFSRIIYALSVAVVPAIVEEFAFRGAVMQPLRKYGDRFAIIASSLVFALLHGNLIQAPFALIAGIGMGYAVCITNSIWTGVIIHFLNNLYSVLISFLIADIPDEDMLNKLYLLITFSLYAFSILGSVVFIILKRRRKLKKSASVLSATEKYSALFINPPIIIAFIIMLIQIADYVDFAN